jgi:Ca2+-binding EF-hand superfamily protein
VNRSFNEEDEVTRLLQKNIAEIKKDIKAADSEKTGSIREVEFLAMMAKYQIKMIKIERRFLKEGGERVDYLRFLKYYL